MRQQIEQWIAACDQTRTIRERIDRAAEPRAWAQADLDAAEAEAHLASAVHDAARKAGLLRELSRALGGTGFSVARLAVEARHAALTVELAGGPETPAERRHAADPAVRERLRQVADDFYTHSGVEVAFPYERLGD